MSDHDPIDFSALDPRADAAHWESLVAGVTRRLPTHGPHKSLSRHIRRAWQPALAIAAMLTLVIWSAALVGSQESDAASDPAYALLAWTSGGEPPSPTTIMSTLGGLR